MAKNDAQFKLPIPLTIVYTILIALSGFMITINTRVAVLENSSGKIEASISEMSSKIDKIYDKIYFEHQQQ